MTVNQVYFTTPQNLFFQCCIVCSSINKTHYTAVLDLVDESGNMLDYNSFTLKHGFACHPKQFFTVINAKKILIRV